MSYPICKIKNISGGELTVYDRLMQPNEVYTIPDTDRVGWATSDDVLWFIADEAIQVGDSSVYFDSLAEQIGWLQTLMPPSVQLSGVALDSELALMSRPKTTAPGWMQQFRCFEFTTAMWNSLVSLRPDDGEPVGDCSIKFYDSNGDEITSEANIAQAVRTEINWEAEWDFDIAGGMVVTSAEITQDVRAWVVAAPDLPAEYGGYKVNICGGLNLRFFQPGIPVTFDGRTTKRLYHSDVYHTNKLRIIMRHPAGVQARVMIIFDTYKE